MARCSEPWPGSRQQASSPRPAAHPGLRLARSSTGLPRPLCRSRAQLHRTECEECLVLQSYPVATQRVELFAADRAGGRTPMCLSGGSPQAPRRLSAPHRRTSIRGSSRRGGPEAIKGQRVARRSQQPDFAVAIPRLRTAGSGATCESSAGFTTGTGRMPRTRTPSSGSQLSRHPGHRARGVVGDRRRGHRSRPRYRSSRSGNRLAARLGAAPRRPWGGDPKSVAASWNRVSAWSTTT